MDWNSSVSTSDVVAGGVVREHRYLGGGALGGTSFGMTASLPAPVLSGVAVTPETALTFPACYACIYVLSTDLASLPAEVERKRRQGGRVPVPGDPRHNLVFCEPNKNCTPMRFKQSLYAHRFGWGNGYAEVKRRGGMPVELHLHSPRPTDTWPEMSRSGSLWYQLDGGRRQVRAEDMIHVAGLGWNGLTGYSPIALHRQSVGFGLAMEAHGAAFYGNAMKARGAIKTTGRMTPEKMKNLRESVDSVHGDVTNSHRLMILEEGMDFVNFSVDPKDAEYIESRRFTLVDMCRIFRVPPPIIMEFLGVSGVYKSLDSMIQHYINFTLRPEIEGSEQEYNRKFFTARERAHGLRVNHDFTALLRADSGARMAYLKGRMECASITPDEVRESEGDNPTDLPSHRKFYISANLVPVDLAGQTKPAPAPAPADPAKPPEAKPEGDDQ